MVPGTGSTPKDGDQRGLLCGPSTCRLKSGVRGGCVGKEVDDLIARESRLEGERGVEGKSVSHARDARSYTVERALVIL